MSKNSLLRLTLKERALISHVYIADFTPFVPELTPSALKELSCQIGTPLQFFSIFAFSFIYFRPGLAVRSWVNSLFEIVAVATEEDAMTRHKKITEPQVISKKSIQSTIQGYIYFLSGDIRMSSTLSLHVHTCTSGCGVFDPSESQNLVSRFWFLIFLVGQRGLCSVQELEVLMEWITENGPHVKAAAQALASLVQNPE